MPHPYIRRKAMASQMIGGVEMLDCPRCGRRAEDNAVPVTVGGWHGDICYGWGHYAGIYMVRATQARCPDCDITWSATRRTKRCK